MRNCSGGKANGGEPKNIAIIMSGSKVCLIRWLTRGMEVNLRINVEPSFYRN